MNQILVGRFICPGVQITWVTDGETDTITKHSEVNGLTQSSVFDTLSKDKAEKIFLEWINEFVTAKGEK